MATETFSIEAMVCGYHVYQDSRDAAIKEQLPCKREPGNHKDPFAVAVVTCYHHHQLCAQEDIECVLHVSATDRF